MKNIRELRAAVTQTENSLREMKIRLKKIENLRFMVSNERAALLSPAAMGDQKALTKVKTLDLELTKMDLAKEKYSQTIKDSEINLSRLESEYKMAELEDAEQERDKVMLIYIQNMLHILDCRRMIVELTERESDLRGILKELNDNVLEHGGTSGEFSKLPLLEDADSTTLEEFRTELIARLESVNSS